MSTIPPNDDQFARLIGLLEAHGSKLDNVSSKVDLVDTRVRSLEVGTENVRIEVARLNFRMTDAEGDIRKLRDKDTEISRQQSSSDLDREAEMASAITHVQRLEQTIETTAKVNDAICKELGLDTHAIENDRVGPEKKTTLKAIAYENKAGAYGSWLALAILLAEIVLKALGK